MPRATAMPPTGLALCGLGQLAIIGAPRRIPPARLPEVCEYDRSRLSIGVPECDEQEIRFLGCYPADCRGHC
jgi:hypothetical protein